MSISVALDQLQCRGYGSSSNFLITRKKLTRILEDLLPNGVNLISEDYRSECVRDELQYMSWCTARPGCPSSPRQPFPQMPGMLATSAASRIPPRNCYWLKKAS